MNEIIKWKENQLYKTDVEGCIKILNKDEINKAENFS